MSHPNALLIERLFAALNRHDHEAMAECYADDAGFHDIAYHLRTKRRIHDMWRMICEGESNIQVKVEAADANDREGTATIVDVYDFGRTQDDPGKRVVNRIRSRFVFDAGRIAKQADDCDPRAWAAMAIGGRVGWIAGRIRLLRSLKANWMLYRFVRNHPVSVSARSGV
jgi:ketosteroid isomerase-like protein